jgi:hypothetical protein
MSWNQAHAPLLIESFPKTPRTQSEASRFRGTHKYKQNKTNKLPCFKDIWEHWQLNMRTFVSSSLSTISRHRQHRVEKYYMSSKNRKQIVSLCHMHRINNGWGPITPERVKSLVAKTWNCYSYRWWWLVQLGHVLVQSITGVPHHWCTNTSGTGWIKTYNHLSAFTWFFCWLFAFVFPLGCVYLCSHLPCVLLLDGFPSLIFIYRVFFLFFFLQHLLVLGADWNFFSSSALAPSVKWA